jgi:hypothetical protein
MSLLRRGVPALLLVAAVVLTGGPDAVAASPFNGSWVSVDPLDGSNQRVRFRGTGKTRTFLYYDDLASICGVENNSPISVRGRGRITTSRVIVVRWGDGTCTATGQTISNIPDSRFRYRPASNSLRGLGAIWHRPG